MIDHLHQTVRTLAAIVAAVALVGGAVGLWNVAEEQRNQNELMAEANCREALGLDRTSVVPPDRTTATTTGDRPARRSSLDRTYIELSDLLSLCLPGGTCPADPSDDFEVWDELLQRQRCEATP